MNCSLQTACVLMTATVTPPHGATLLRHADPKIRLAEYTAALNFYANAVGERGHVVLVENSGCPMDDLVREIPEALKDRVECVLFNGNDYPPKYGKGYGEFKILDRAMSRSPILQQLGDAEMIWKVTGRLIVRNIQRYLRHDYPFELACDVYKRHSWLDLRIYGFTRIGYHHYLTNVAEEIRKSPSPQSPEHILFQRLSPEFGKNVCPRLHAQPEFVGVSGKTGKRYDRGTERVKYQVRRAVRTVAPGWWI